MQAIVFNGNYLNYFDVAFTEYWRATGLPDVIAQAEAGLELFARKATVEYHAPARFDDVLEIGVPQPDAGEPDPRRVRGPGLFVSGEGQKKAHGGIARPVACRPHLRAGRPVPRGGGI